MFRGTNKLIDGLIAAVGDLGSSIGGFAKTLERIETKISAPTPAQSAPVPSKPEPFRLTNSPQLDRVLEEYAKGGRDKWLGIGTPWITEGAKSWLDKNILPTDSVLEFGAGRSTIFWAAKAGKVTCVEASPDWFMWVFMYLYSRPDLIKKVRLYFCPTDWNPAFIPKGMRRYWTDNRQALAEQDIYDLEAALITPSFPGHNVMLFDGSLRGPVFVYQASVANFDEVEVIVVDNTETGYNGAVGDYLIPKNFIRYDFAAGPKDDVPAHQNGKHITTIYVREDRAQRSTSVLTAHPPVMSPEDRERFMLSPIPGRDAVLTTVKEYEDQITRVTGKPFSARLF